jgi:hypothetical protein
MERSQPRCLLAAKTTHFAVSAKPARGRRPASWCCMWYTLQVAAWAANPRDTRVRGHCPQWSAPSRGACWPPRPHSSQHPPNQRAEGDLPAGTASRTHCGLLFSRLANGKRMSGCAFPDGAVQAAVPAGRQDHTAHSIQQTSARKVTCQLVPRLIRAVAICVGCLPVECALPGCTFTKHDVDRGQVRSFSS